VTSNRTTRKDCEDGHEAAERKAAAAAVGDGAVSARTTRLTTIPSHQRASDSHDYTRLATLKVLNGLLEIRTGRLKKQDAGLIALNLSELNSLRREAHLGAP
jgi:hypothetical protein